MSNGAHKTSLDNLAHIANISHELSVLNSQLRQDEAGGNSPTASNAGSADNSRHESGNVMVSKTGKPKKISCIECRQQKSKCDAYERHPEPCTRCSKKALRCDIRSDYKRTYKRARIAQIEKEFSELKKSLTAAQAAELLRRVPTLSTNGSPLSVESVASHLQSPAFQQLQSQYQTHPPLSSPNPQPLPSQPQLQSQIHVQPQYPQSAHSQPAPQTRSQSPLHIQTPQRPPSSSTPPIIYQQQQQQQQQQQRQFHQQSQYDKPTSSSTHALPDTQTNKLRNESSPHQSPHQSPPAQTPLHHPFPSTHQNTTFNDTTRAVSLSPFNGVDTISPFPRSATPVTKSLPQISKLQSHNPSALIPSRANNKTPPTSILESALVVEEKTLDTVTLSPETIRSLYLEYVGRYHPILPVVDVAKGPERIYKLCPSLFWVIMFVSLRRWAGDANKALLLTLSPLIKDILAEITISPITRYNPTEEDEPIINACSVYSVQAFLLYTFWPPITSSLSADSSWNTIGVALFQAIRIGLHSPSSLSDHITTPKTPQQLAMAHEQAKTWIICNIASQSIAASFGFPAFVQFDASIWGSCRPGSSISIPKSIQYMMEIAHFEDQIAKTLNSNTMDPYGLIDASERLPLLKVLSRQLDELELKVVNDLPGDDGFRIFQLLTARVHLFTYYFLDSSKIAQFELSKGLVRLYNATVALVNHAQLCQARDPFFVKYLPVVYMLNVWQASCIIAKLAHSPLKHVIDINAGKQSYQAAISLAAKASILKHDMAHRSSGIMRNMWQLFRTLEEKNLITLDINIRSRMAASVFFDCLFLLRDQVGMIKLNSRNDGNQGLQVNDNDDDDDDDDDEGEDDDEILHEEAVVSDEEGTYEKNGVDQASSHQGDSQKSTPSGSNTSSRTKRQRSLSNTVNAESKARRIIRTIPLDPQPISAPSKRSNIFKVVNNSTDSSPTVKQESHSTPNSNESPMSNVSNSTNRNAGTTPNVSNLRSTDSIRNSQRPATQSNLMQKAQHQQQFSHPSQPASQSAHQPQREGGQQHMSGNMSNQQYVPEQQHQQQQQQQHPFSFDYPIQSSSSGLGHKDSIKMAISGNSINRSIPSGKGNANDNGFQGFIGSSSGSRNNNGKGDGLPEMYLHESPPVHASLENLEFDHLDMNSDLLWKDVDSVMNDFGFHTQ